MDKLAKISSLFLIILTTVLLTSAYTSALSLDTYFDNNLQELTITDGETATYYVNVIPDSSSESTTTTSKLFDDTYGSADLIKTLFTYFTEESTWFSDPYYVTPDDYSGPGEYFIDIRTDQDSPQPVSVSDQLYLTVEAKPNIAPVADFTFSPSDPVTDEFITFTSFASDEDGSVVSYDWDFDDDMIFEESSSDAEVVSHTFSTPGSYLVHHRVKDDKGAYSPVTTKEVVVAQANRPPVMEEIDDQSIDEKTNYDIELEVSDPDNDVLRCYVVDVPSWLTLDPEMCELFGTSPDVSVNTQYYVKVGVKDPDGLADEQDYRLTVIANVAPVADFTFSPSDPVTDEFITFTSFASDEDGSVVSYDWDFDDDMIFETTGSSVERSFSTPGDYPVSHRVKDDDGDYSIVVTKIVTVTQANRAPSIADVDDCSVDEEDYYSYGFDVSDPDGDTLECYDAGSGEDKIPDWLSLDADSCVLFGTAPSVSADTDYAIIVGVRDPDGLADETSYVLTVLNVNKLPVASFDWSPSDPVTDEVVTFTSSATDSDGTISTYYWDLDDDGTFEVIEGSASTTKTFSMPGDYVVRHKVKDNEGAYSEVVSKTVVVSQANRPPVMEPVPDHSTPEDEFYEYVLDVSDPDGDDLTCYDATYSSSSTGGDNSQSPEQAEYMPDWLTLDEENCILSGMAPEVASDLNYFIMVGVRDPDGLTDEQSYNLIVENVNIAPVADFTYDPVDPIAGETVTFTSTSTDCDGAVDSYSWSFGDGSSAEGEVVEHVYSDAGSYTVIHKVTDDEGLKSSVSKEVVVSDESFSGISVSADPDSGVAPLVVSLSCVAFGGDLPVSYSWDLGDDSSSSVQNLSHTYEVAGNYDAVCIATDVNGDVISGSVAIVVTAPNVAPVADFVFSPESPVTGDVITFTSASYDNDGTIVSYDWDFDDDGVFDASGSVVYHSFDVVGDYPVTHKVVDDDGAESSVTKMVAVSEPVVNHAPVMEPIPDHSTPEDEFYEYVLDVSDPDGDDLTCYEVIDLPDWLSLDADACVLFGTAPEVISDVNYLIHVGVRDPDGLTDDEYYYLTVYDINKAPVASFAYDPADPITKETITFTSTSYDEDGTISEYLWDLDDDGFWDASGESVIWSFDSEGTHIVTHRVTDDAGLSDTVQEVVTVTNSLITSVVVSADPVSGVAPLTVNFSCVALGGDFPVSYSWSFGDGSSSSLQNPVHTYGSVGEFTATCTATDINDDSASDSVVITVTESNHAPVMEEIPDQSVDENEAYSYQLVVSDPDGDDLTCYLAQGPSWLSVDPDGCVVFGTAPEVEADTDYLIVVGVRDPDGLTDEESYHLTIIDVPPENIPPVAGFTYDPANPITKETITFTSTSTDSDGTIASYSWSFGDGSSAEGLVVEHSYSQIGTYLVTHSVVDDDDADDSITEEIVVTNEVFSDIVVSADPDSGYAPLTVSLTCSAIGGDFPVSYSWSFGDGQFGQGSSVEHVYTDVGDYSPVCTAVDVNGDVIGGSVSVVVTEPVVNHAPVMEPIPDHSTPEAEFYSYQLEVSDPDGDKLECYAIDIPDWLSLDADACVLSGNAPEVIADINYWVFVGVRDPEGLTDEQSYYLTVYDVNVAPVADFTYDPVGPVVGDVVTFTSTSYDEDGSIVSYDWDFDNDGIFDATGKTVEHTFSVEGDHPVTHKVIDDEDSEDSVTKTVVVGSKPNPILRLKEFSCNDDVVKGKQEYCSAFVTDEDDVAVIEATVNVYYDGGDYFGTCTTDWKGYCNLEPVVNKDPGVYTVVASAQKPDYINSNELRDSFKVWDERYSIVGLEVYDDGSFNHPEDEFYRGEKMYAEFAIFDQFTEEYSCDDSLVRDVFLRVNNADPLSFVEWNELSRLEVVEPNIVEKAGSLFGLDAACKFRYWLSDGIPLTDDYLGEGRVFAFAFNFSDNSAGQDSKIVTVLNNPVSFDLPDSFMIYKDTPDVESSIVIDLKDFSDDLETPDDELLFDAFLQVPPSDGTLSITKLSNGIYRITAGEDYVETALLTAVVDDTDGSKQTRFADIIINVAFTPHAPVADFAWSPKDPVVESNVSFESLAEDEDGDIVDYLWDFDDDGVWDASGESVDLTFLAEGDHPVTHKVIDEYGLSDEITKIVTVTAKPLPVMLIEEFSCNENVIRGQREYCTAKVTSDGNPVGGAEVTINYGEDFGGNHFGTCITNFKGFCAVDPVVGLDAGVYSVDAVARKLGYEQSAVASDSFKVWEKRYEIRDLEVYGDDSFSEPESTFYRGEEMYSEFIIYDLFKEEYSCDDSLVRDVFLRVNNADPLSFVEWNELSRLEVVEPNIVEKAGSLFGLDAACKFRYWLSDGIPLTDDYLGEGRVFAFAFNFADNTAGQSSKQVTVLNNPVSFDLPDSFTIYKDTPDVESSVTIDLKEYAEDLETPADEMKYAISLSDDGLLVNDLGDGVFKIVAPSGFMTDAILTAHVDDTDGSTNDDTAKIIFDVAFIPLPPVAIAGPDQEVFEDTQVSFDAGDSYDPDGGVIVNYHWDFGNGESSDSASPLSSTVYDDPGIYTVTLIVTDDEGDTAVDYLIVTVDDEPFVPVCSDGLDNDGDGLVDMDDPGCKYPGDATEWNSVPGIEKGVKIVSISTYGPDGDLFARAGDILMVEVVLENFINEDIDELRVGFSIPELGVQQKSSMFNLKEGTRKTKNMLIYLPWDISPGDYYTEITVANDELRRSTHRNIKIVD